MSPALSCIVVANLARQVSRPVATNRARVERYQFFDLSDVPPDRLRTDEVLVAKCRRLLHAVQVTGSPIALEAASCGEWPAVA